MHTKTEIITLQPSVSTVCVLIRTNLQLLYIANLRVLVAARNAIFVIECESIFCAKISVSFAKKRKPRMESRVFVLDEHVF